MDTRRIAHAQWRQLLVQVQVLMSLQLVLHFLSLQEHLRNRIKTCLTCHMGVINRAHTSIDNFIGDIDPVFKKLNDEKKQIYIMGDFNIDLLKVDDHRPIHDYLELIFSYSLLPTIYKPTRITETTATSIDNILTNDENVIKSSILVTDITDHMPTVKQLATI